MKNHPFFDAQFVTNRFKNCSGTGNSTLDII